jgi:membrane protein YdbS with pleckstrin-like domain
MKIPEKGVVYKTSRISYVSNYVILALVLILISLAWPYLNLKFSLVPKTAGDFWSTMVIFAFILIITFLLEEPSIERIIRKYVVTNNEVTKIEGIFRKKKFAIPYQSVADIKLEQGVVGRIFNFGNVCVTGVVRGDQSGGAEAIILKGIRNPDEVYRIVQNKINLMRGAIISKEGKKE